MKVEAGNKTLDTQEMKDRQASHCSAKQMRVAKVEEAGKTTRKTISYEQNYTVAEITKKAACGESIILVFFGHQ